MSQGQLTNINTTINNTIDFGKKVTPYAALYFIGKLIMDALNDSMQNFSQLKLRDSVKAVHIQKLIWAFCVITLFAIFFLKKIVF